MPIGDVDTQNKNPLITKSPPNNPQEQTDGWNLVKTFKALRLPQDSEGHAWAVPVMVVDPQSPGMVPMGVKSIAVDNNGLVNGPMTYSVPMLVNKVTTGVEGQRTPTIWKNVGNYAATGFIWTPAAGKKVRVMGFNICVPGTCTMAVAGQFQIVMYVETSGATIWSGACTLSNAVQQRDTQFNINFPGNGYLVPTADKKIALDFTTALTAGVLQVTIWGTEE